ncbi:hypothetical protein PHAVU_008G258600 [Phaseolus vulgaris]|uniref:Glutaredoxin domain-containing protein n=1 Tax=Phaseolus vulgaris TaxID=3885 RepID=V7B9E3_PHAVU|nr:hypothetical protein PHAVU_008G258600g [Phaseolus vulgaris]ESW14170.1 hypothetical protein PHAVU_008G258600g [Phaseolus vulgaris]
MWRPWGKSTVQTSPSSSSFSCSSFKDIQTLCLDEPPQRHNQPHQEKPSPSPSRKPSIFHRVRLANSLLRTWSTHHHPQPSKHPKTPQHSNVSKPEKQPRIYFPGTEERVVVYYTSLHAVRPTFDACKNVFSILCGFRVLIDDRDVSMDAGFAAELSHMMGLGRAELDLPRVFIGGKYIGGIEELRQLNEVGELKKLLEDLPTVDRSECRTCAAHRFVLCEKCNGSTRVFVDNKLGFKTCNLCNENGLLRCPSCLSTTPTSL